IGAARPVDGILEPAGDRSVVFGSDEQDGVGLADGAFEIPGNLWEIIVIVIAVERQLTEGYLAEIEGIRRELYQGLGELAIDRFAGKAAHQVAHIVAGHSPVLSWVQFP